MDEDLIGLDTGLDTAIAEARDNIQTISAKLVQYDAPSGVRYMGDMLVHEVRHLTQLLDERDRTSRSQHETA